MEDVGRKIDNKIWTKIQNVLYNRSLMPSSGGSREKVGRVRSQLERETINEIMFDVKGALKEEFHEQY